MPDIEILKNLNYSEKEISKLKNSYVLNKKLSIDNFNQDLGEFGKLLSNYDIDKLEIGMISFLNKPINSNEDYFIIGKVEADNLLYSKKKSLFYVQDKTSVLWECASSPENFLGALLNMMEYFSKVAVDESLFENWELLENYAKKSSELAGGKHFQNFYKMLLGI